MKKRLIVTSFVLAGSMVFTQATQFQFSRKPVLVNCEGFPCYRLEFNAVSDSGNLLSIPVDPQRDLETIEIFELDRGEEVFLGGRQEVYHPFYLRFPTEDGGQAGKNCTMVVLDLSGSMLRRLPSGVTRFEAAQSAVDKYAQDLRRDIDFVAVAPFESRQVLPRIRAAAFNSSPEAVRSETGRLMPDIRGNTALYSAIYEALEILRQKSTEGEGVNVSLIVLTDGKNDVGHSGDDPGLFQERDREEVKRRAQEYGIETITIGFGTRGDQNFDEPALQYLAYPNENNYYYAGSQEELEEAFAQARRRLKSRMRLTFGPVRDRKDVLAGNQAVSFRVDLKSQGISGVSPAWTAAGLVNWEDSLDDQERLAFADRVTITRIFLEVLLLRLTVLGVFLLLLGVLWFGFPRMVWPERYLRVPVVSGPRIPTVRTPSARVSGPGGMSASVSGPHVPSPRVPTPRVPTARMPSPSSASAPPPRAPQAPRPQPPRAPAAPQPRSPYAPPGRDQAGGAPPPRRSGGAPPPRSHDPRVTISPSNRPAPRPERPGRPAPPADESKRRANDATMYMPPGQTDDEEY